MVTPFRNGFRRDSRGHGVEDWNHGQSSFLSRPSATQAQSPPRYHSFKYSMKLLNTYDDRDEAEEAAEKLTGDKRLASERDATVVIYNLFGIPSWGNFHRLGMYNLGELKSLLERRASWQPADQARHTEIIAMLKTVAKNYGIEVPGHWL